MSGTLFVVATPIGNLEDLTFRALRTLREVDLIAAEDTRRTSKLLAHYEIRKSLVSLREHNEARQGARLVADLEKGKTIALVTDAGTPGIADPGARFVRLAREHQIKVVPIPGCSAITTALSASGVEADQFVFAGFAPAGSKLTSWVYDLQSEPRTIVFYVPAHAIIEVICIIAEYFGYRQSLVWRELTKVHEESIQIVSDVASNRVEPKGEFVVVIGPRPRDSVSKPDLSGIGQSASDLLDYVTKYQGIDEQSALAMVASRFDLRPADIRKLVKKHRILVKQHKAAVD